MRQFQDQQAKSSGRIRQLADQIADIAAGKSTGEGTSPANFSITQLLPRMDFEVLIRDLNQLKGVDLLSAPRVTTLSGQQATVEIVREFTYPVALDRKSKPQGKTAPTPTTIAKKTASRLRPTSPTFRMPAPCLSPRRSIRS